MRETVIAVLPSFVSVNGVEVTVLPTCALEMGKPASPVEKMAIFVLELAPVPESCTVCVKNDPLTVLVRLLSPTPALSPN